MSASTPFALLRECHPPSSMPRDIRCPCGFAIRVEEDAAPYWRLCPKCGLPFPPHNQVAEAVPVAPYYAPAAAPAIGYQVVEVADMVDKKLPPPLPLPPKPGPRPERSWDAARWSRGEMDDREVRRILAEAKRELIKHGGRPPKPWPLELGGFECLHYPFRARRGVPRLAFFWSLAFLVSAKTLSLQSPQGLLEAVLPNVPMIMVLIAFFYLVGVTWDFLRQVLRLAVMGDSERVPTVGFLQYVGTIARCGLMVAVAFFAGPALILAAALYFWINAGTLDWFDHLLLWQLWLCAGISWVYLLLAVDGRGRLRDAQAKAVAPLFRRQGWHAVLFPVAGGVSLTLFAYLSMRIWIDLFESTFLPFVVQYLLCSAALFFWTFLLRWYGISRYWTRQNVNDLSVVEQGH